MAAPRFTLGALACALATLAAHAAAADGAPDLVLLHGKIHTQDATRRVVPALAVRGNTIVATGTDADISALRGPATRTINLAGRTVLPGLIDAHTHPAQGAQDLGKCNLSDAALSSEQILAQAKACYRANPGDPRHWFEVTQVNPSAVSLSLADLDSIAGKRPLLLLGSDGHTTWANSAALAAAHISAASKDPVGGRIERDAAGRPTGTLRDAASDQLQLARPAYGLAHQAAQLGRAFAAMRATGLTSVQDAAVDDATMQIYKRLYDEHRLDMRVRASYTLTDLGAPADAVVAGAIAFRTKWAVDPDFLRADAVKIFADGVIEYPSQTAALLEPYLDASGRPTSNRGPSYFTQDNLNRIVSAADAAGFTVHIHAIGDRAIRSALDAFAYARTQQKTDNRDQIAHLELINPADFPRFKQLGVIANFQLQWAVKESYIVGGTLAYLGPERSKYLYPARSLLDAGAVIAGGSDWNVSTFNAFEAMEHAVTRRAGRGADPLLPEQAIPLQVAVDAYTINAAFALKQEASTGSLDAGKRADFIVLDRDIFSIPAFDLHATRVLATYLDGREVYHASTKRAAGAAR